MRTLFFLIAISCSMSIAARNYVGRVTDSKGDGIGYATIYLKENPIVGTATNDKGYFTLETDADTTSTIIISFIGYEKREVPLALFANDSVTILLNEQPIALQEMVISAPPLSQRNKRKQMVSILLQVYNKMVEDFPNENIAFRVVSDARMESEGTPWGMEQMIASSVIIPNANHLYEDSIQFKGEYCKRFLKPNQRAQIDSIYAGKMDPMLRKGVNEIDSGVIVHQVLWARDIRHAFAKRIEDPKKWQITNENEGETVLTYTEKKNYIGIFKYTFSSHFIIDSETYAILRFAEEINVAVSIPFGYRLKGEELQYLNLFNLSGKEITKFRIRRFNGTIRMNTIYGTANGVKYPKEKNMLADAIIQGTKKEEIPLKMRVTQHATQVKTKNVKPMPYNKRKQRIPREIVEIY